MENFNFGCVGADDYLLFKLTKLAVFLKKNSFENFTNTVGFVNLKSK